MIEVVKLKVNSPGYVAIDLTEEVRRKVKELGTTTGIVSVFTNEQGCAIIGIEYETGLLADLERLIKEKLKPVVAEAFMGSSFTVPVVSGDLMIGGFKRIVLVDLSGKSGEKEVIITVVGNAHS